MTTIKFTSFSELKNWLFDLWEHNLHIEINDTYFNTVKLNMLYDRELKNMEFYNATDIDLSYACCIINLKKIKHAGGYDIEIVE